MIWRTKTGDVDLSKRAMIMGILNVTADSFSDGGKFLGVENAVAHVREMIAQGAEIIDVGGESTRPGAEPVAEEEEMARVLPVIERMKAECRMQKEELNAMAGSHSAFISIDTSKAAVARAAIERGASIVNDVTGLRGDPAMMDVVRETGAGVVIMHSQGTPRDMQIAPHYDDVVAEIRDFFRQSFDRAVACGIDPMSIAFDPGIGFGKTVAHNLSLLRNLASLRVADRPLVLGVSRKSFIGKVLAPFACHSERSEESRELPSGVACEILRSAQNDTALNTQSGDERLLATVALTSFGREHGANIFRVHDVAENVVALRMTEAILAP